MLIIIQWLNSINNLVKKGQISRNNYVTVYPTLISESRWGQPIDIGDIPPISMGQPQQHLCLCCTGVNKKYKIACFSTKHNSNIYYEHFIHSDNYVSI